MPRFRLAARFLRACSTSSPSESCPSCASAAAAAGRIRRSGSGSSSSPSTPPPLPPPPAPSPAPLFLRSIPFSSSPAASRQKKSNEEESRVGRLGRIPSQIRDCRSDVILGQQQQQVWLPGQRASPAGRSGWILQAFSVAYSTDSPERDHHRHDDQEELENSGLVSASLQERQEEGEDEVPVVDGEGFYVISHGRTPAAPPGDSRRSATFLRGEGEEVDASQLGSALPTSSDEDEVSDLSELELADVDNVCSQSKDGTDDSQPLAKHGQPEEEREDAQRADWRLEHMPQDAAADREEVASSELVLDFFNSVSTTPDDAGEMGLIESEPDGDLHRDGLPYLHALSVDEIQEILEKARAKDVRILQVRKSCEWVDELVFASGRSSRHLRGMADAIVHKVKQLSANVGPNSFPMVEGRDGEQWMAVDCGNIVVHLFLEEARSYYNLEEFWRKKSNPRLVETY